MYFGLVTFGISDSFWKVDIFFSKVNETTTFATFLAVQDGGTIAYTA